MDIVEYEMQRYSNWMEELKLLKREEKEDSQIFKKHMDKLNTEIRKQEQLFRGVLLLRF